MHTSNLLNVSADKNAYGKWATLNQEYFANPVIIKELFNFFQKAYPTLPKKLNIIDVGSAEGFVGEYFSQELLHQGFDVSLFLLDVVKEHLEQNKNPVTTKIHLSLLKFKEKEKYDVMIVSSILHYFSFEEQDLILKKMYEGLKKGGYLLLKAFIPFPESWGLFLMLNHFIGKDYQLLSQTALEQSLRKEFGKEVSFLGDATLWNCTSENLKSRYQLTDKQITTMRDLIQTTDKKSKNGFYLTPTGFTAPIPYKIYLCRKK